MRFDGNIFPHPVLGRSNDVSGKYQPLPPQVEIEKSVEIKIKHQLFCAPIMDEIKKGNANFCVEIHCLNTYFRKTYVSKEEDQLISIPSGELRGNVELNYLVIANYEYSYKYTNAFHKDYEGMVFQLEKGMPLAYGGSSNFEVADEFSGNGKGSSFISVIQDDQRASGPFEVELGTDRLVISLPRKEFQLYHSLHQREEYSRYFHSSIAAPSIAYAISIMASTSGDTYADRKWYQAIKAKIDSEPELNGHEISETDSLIIAQKILKNPFLDTLENIRNNIGNEEEED
ncbi:MAG: hypothetical protein EBS19_02105 [Spirochaetia bacterium]|nr:hypothetical protein [Spirochaetia bacterium]